MIENGWLEGVDKKIQVSKRRASGGEKKTGG